MCTGLRRFFCPGQEGKKRGGSKGGTACTDGYKGVRAVRPESVGGGGWFWGVMEFGMSRRIKPKEKYVRISLKEMCRNLDGPPKSKELWSYVVKFEFSRPELACITISNPFLLTFQKYPFKSIARVTLKKILTAHTSIWNKLETLQI